MTRFYKSLILDRVERCYHLLKMAPLKSLSISHLANQPAHPGKHSHLRFHQKFLAGTFESQRINQQKFRRMSWSMLTVKRC